MNCYKCGQPITKDNESIEHILPNFLGGKLTSTYLLCEKCNNEFGSTIDRELHRQLDFAAVIVVDKRHRKSKNPGTEMETLSGEKTIVGKQLIPKPKLTIKIPGRVKPIVITANNDEELVRIADEKKKELEVKFGEFKLTKSIEYPSEEKRHFKNSLSTAPGEMIFGGGEYYRGIGKIMVNYYLYACKPTTIPNSLKQFVNGGDFATLDHQIPWWSDHQ